MYKVLPITKHIQYDRSHMPAEIHLKFNVAQTISDEQFAI